VTPVTPPGRLRPGPRSGCSTTAAGEFEARRDGPGLVGQEPRATTGDVRGMMPGASRGGGGSLRLG